VSRNSCFRSVAAHSGVPSPRWASRWARPRTAHAPRSGEGRARPGGPRLRRCLSGSCQFLAKFRQNVARLRLFRHRFSQQNMRFAAFFKIYQIFKLKFLKFGNILQILRHLRIFFWIFTKIAVFSNRVFAKILRLQRCNRMQIL